MQLSYTFIMDVSVIIVNFNTKEVTRDCIDSVVAQTKDIEYEIILVDNASSDGSTEFFAGDSRIKFIQSGANLGFGKGNNLGVEHALGKYVFFLNSDTLLLNNAVKRFYDFMEAHGAEYNIGALGTLLLDANHNRAHSYAALPTIGAFLKAEWGDHILKRFGRHVPRYDENAIDPDEQFFPVGYVTGADLFCTRDILIRGGAFDPDFFMYCEESEMQARWKRQLGVTNYILRGPEIVHLEGKSGATKSFRKGLVHIASFCLYFKKTEPLPKYLLFRLCLLLGRLHIIFLPSLSMKDKMAGYRSLTKWY